MTETLTAEILLQAYAAGVFPMAQSRDDPELFWMDPALRGVFELENFHISRSLARKIRKNAFEIKVNTSFMQVVAGCADRTETWINAPLLDLYADLHHKGHAHCLEVWQNNLLVGGVFGLTIGGAFFGESMFSRQKDASKIALAYLMDRLRIGGFRLFDTQFITPHLASLGAVEIPRSVYHSRLEQAIKQSADFLRQSETPSPYSVLQRNTQTS